MKEEKDKSTKRQSKERTQLKPKSSKVSLTMKIEFELLNPNFTIIISK